MYKYKVTYYTNLGDNSLFGYREDSFFVEPLNSIEIRYSRVEDEVFFIQDDLILKFKGEDAEKLKSIEYNSSHLDSVIEVYNSNVVIYKGVINIQESKKCDCDLELRVESTSIEKTLIENWETSINVLDDRLVNITNSINKIPSGTQNNLIRYDELFLELAKFSSPDITDFESEFLNGVNDYVYGGTNYFNDLYISESSNFINNDTLTEPASYQELSFKDLYFILKTNYGLRIFFEGTKIRLEHYTYLYSNSENFEHKIENSCTYIDEYRSMNLNLTGTNKSNDKYRGVKDIRFLIEDPNANENDPLAQILIWRYSNRAGNVINVKNEFFAIAVSLVDEFNNDFYLVFSNSGTINLSNVPTYDNYLFHSFKSEYFAIGRERYDPFFSFKSFRSFKNPNLNKDSIYNVEGNVSCYFDGALDKNYFLFNDLLSENEKYRIKEYTISVKNKNITYNATIL